MMANGLFVAVIGERKSGKSTRGNTLFAGAVKTARSHDRFDHSER
jgi:ABC-type oligopeptide transport system ATPase subunit